MFGRSAKIPLQRERFELADGDFVDLDWALNPTGPIVVLLHGLEGNSASHYIQGVLPVIHAQGWRGMVMHFRGCSGEPNRLARTYHSGDTADLTEVLTVLRNREPTTPIHVVGYSLGGNVLLKYLGEQPSGVSISSAVAVCVPMVLSVCARRLEQGFSRLYQWLLLKSLKKKVAQKFSRLRSPINLERLGECSTFRIFDDVVTAPLHGFKDVDDYYRNASARQHLADIRIPTLVIHADDDPFMTDDVLANPDELSSSVQIEVTTGGGHIGFIEGAVPFRPRYWLDNRIVRFIFTSANI